MDTEKFKFIMVDNLADILYSRKCLTHVETKVDFTFDTQDAEPSEPSQWYGVKIEELFGNEVLLMAGYGINGCHIANLDDPTSIACVRDNLQEMLDKEYGSHVSEVCIEICTPVIRPVSVFVEVDGGMVRNVYTDNKELEFHVTVCDYDDKREEEKSHTEDEAIKACEMLEEKRSMLTSIW